MMITVLTPTYNRAHTLPRLYESLKGQPGAEFEWLVVDDGSSDGTEELLRAWQSEEKEFELRRVKQPNGGKHRAVNHGVSLAKGEWVFVVDSDDYLPDGALARVAEWTEDIRGLEGFAGVAGLKADQNGAVSGGSPRLGPEGRVDVTNFERDAYALGGEKAEVYRTEILKRFPFPEFEGENFITEAVAWDAIAQAGYRLRWYGQVIYRFEYCEDGLTEKARSEKSKAAQRLKNHKGYEYRVKQQLALGDKRNYLSAVQGWSQMARLRGDGWREISAFLHTPTWKIRLINLAFALREKLKGRK